MTNDKAETSDPAFALRDARVAIVGLGLMGGSLALALRARNACKEILVVERDADVRAQAISRGVADRASADLSFVAQAEIIVLATPVRTIIMQLPQVGERARAGAMVIDLGSTKREIARAMEALPPDVQPIGGHPMCGKEVAGFDAADANLFRGAVFVLTPLARTSPQTLARARSIIDAVGARPLILEPARHDKIVAATSHLPFVLAAMLMTAADDLARDDELVFTLAASGFRDTSRLAASDTPMMSDVLLTNREDVARVMREYARQMSTFADVIERGDEATLRAVLENAAMKRRALFK
jgi:prephenate dehydrogenase